MARAVVKAVADTVAKWVRRAGSASEEYRQGVQSTSADWAAATAAAAPAYAAGVQEAITRGAFAKGVTGRGTAGWKDRAVTLGPARYSQGVGAGESSYSSAMGPVLAAISSVDLPPRGATGSESNYGRVAAVGKALRALKTGRR